MNDETSAPAVGPATSRDSEFEPATPKYIRADRELITPDMLPLIEFDQEHIDVIVRTVPGGARNVQDIYPLSPLQQGMLFHRLMSEQSDTYVLSVLFELRSREQLEALRSAIQEVIDRNDALRTAILWEQLPKPVQVVHRSALLPVEQLPIAREGDVLEQLAEQLRPQRRPMDLRQAPLLRLEIAADAQHENAYAVLRVHHLICDHGSLNAVIAQVTACLDGRQQDPPVGVPYDYVTRVPTSADTAAAEAFFSDMLAGIDESTAPFGLTDVHGDGRQIDEARQQLDPTSALRLRAQARRLNVSPARLFHSAWALVVAGTSGRDDVVYGTVLRASLLKGAQSQRMLGMTVNTLPLRVSLQNVSVSELVEQTHRTLVGLVRHEQMPLTLAQRCSELAGAAPLFTSLLNFRRSLPAPEHASVAGVRVIARGEAWTNYPITMIVDDLGDEFALTAQSDRRVPPQRLIGYLQAAVQSMLDAIEYAPQTPALALSIVPETERHQILDLFNATAAAYPQHKSIHGLFEEQVERTPHAVAVLHESRFLTYRQLNGRANQLARYLRRHGAGPDRFVGLFVERSIEMIVGMLGILKAGAAYVPLDPSYPAHRIEHMLNDTAPILVLTQERLKTLLPVGSRCASLDTQWDEIAHQPATRPSDEETPGVSSADLAYVIYTSGSTGLPKGVAIEHRNAVNLICWAHEVMSPETFDLTLQSTSLNFDLSVYECFVPLTTGGSIRVVDSALALTRERYDVTLINTVPSAIKAVVDAGSIPPTTRAVHLAGEALKQELVERIFAHSAVATVCNLYGPSETTTYSTWVAMPRAAGFVGTIGRPIANTQVYILDRQGDIAPIGVVGEIYIGGAGVARGYLNRPELTAERFLPDRFRPGCNARMYRTGDLGRWRCDGEIEYLGRNDHQVKIRGFRVELAEIETQLMRYGHLRETVVIAREDVPGEKRLLAYAVPADPSNAPSSEALRAHLREVLPEYMVPSAFLMLDRMPLTPNGKLDRRALPTPQRDAYATWEYEAPQGEVEEALAAIWQSLLQLERVGRHDNFFELGGHSLLIVQMMERLRRCGLSTEVHLVFEAPTLAELAVALTSAAPDQLAVSPNLIPPACAAITPEMLPLIQLEAEHIERIAASIPGGAANIQDIYPLGSMQEGILFHHLLTRAAGDTYVLPAAFYVASRSRVDELVAALQAVIDRHDSLRTAILWEELPRPVQVVQRQATLQVTRISLDTHADVAAQIEAWLKPERQSLDIRCAPLLRLQVAADPRGTGWYVVLQLHHVIIDHVTLELLTAEVVSILEGRSADLPAPLPYRNHIARALARAKAKDTEAFFRGKLADISEPTAPFGLLDVHGDGTQIEEAREELGPDLARRIRAQSRRLGVSAATLFHAAWALVVAHTSGRDEVVFGTLLLGRLHGHSDAQHVLGVFINTLPLRISLRDTTAVELVERMQRELIELLTYEQASLPVAQRCSAVDSSAPLFTALLNYRHSVSTLPAQWSRAHGVEMLRIQERTNYPLTVAVDDLGEGFTLNAQTDRRIDPCRITGYLHTAMGSLVAALERDAQAPALRLPVLPQSESHQILELFNPAAVTERDDRLIHELFEEQVERTPHAVAVVCGGASLTYSDLNSRANQLARAIRACEVGVDQGVGLCIERSVEMVVGLLAILKAGAAYIPLDPEYPAERLAHMVEDAALRVVLTQQHLTGLLPPTSARIIAIDGSSDELAGHASNNLDGAVIGLRPEHLAYVIYTSGSTGLPKGVMVEHRNVVTLWRSLQQAYERCGQGAQIALNASLNFDASVQQIVQLLSGRAVHVVPEDCRRDAARLLRFLQEHGIVAIDCTPSQLKAWIGAGLLARGASALRTVLVGGEPIESDLWDSLSRCTEIDFYNVYGPTECTVDSTIARINGDFTSPHVGRPMRGRRVYIVGRADQPAPLGAVGEILIGGAGIARGYLDRPELTAERFVPDPFVTGHQARCYKTGDLGRWRVDGTIEYLGRNDQQVKIRGYRIELGEIEAQLRHSGLIEDVAVVVREDALGDKRLVAYVTQAAATVPAAPETLRAHLKTLLPEYMIPSAFVTLDSLPLTPSGKLNRRALPAPQLSAYAHRQYEAPQGEVEEILAGIWQSLLQIERVGRHDNFFELGGHSLLIVQMLERLRRIGLSTAVRRVFESPSLADLAGVLTASGEQVAVPPNLIPPGCDAIAPDMLPLVELTAQQIDAIAAQVPGGAANIQDIYPLTPPQEGILFHHVLNERGGDTYVVPLILSVDSLDRLHELLAALQAVVDRHDVLRTAVLWEDLPRPVQLVHRRARLRVDTVSLDRDRDTSSQLQAWLDPTRQRLDLRRAPLMRVTTAQDQRLGGWYVLLQLHHMTTDHVAVEMLTMEVVAQLEGRAQQLHEPSPYRNHVARSLASARTDDARSFFRSKLAGVTESTAPFGLLDILGDGSRVDEARQSVEPALASRIRAQARRMAVSAATVFHAAWALVVARTSGRDDVVFGSVLLGRMQEDVEAQRTLGMFINTLPLRLRLSDMTARSLVECTQRELVELLTHEQAPLPLAQACSELTGSAPLFTALLNYRHSGRNPEAEWSHVPGINVVAAQERTNYPIAISVDDLGDGFTLTAQTDRSIEPWRVNAYLHTAVESLVAALEKSPQTLALALAIVPGGELHQIVNAFNMTQAAYPRDKSIHELFEARVQITPNAPAVVYEGESLTYAELNGTANQLARYLRAGGLTAGEYVPVLMSRSLQMLLVQLALLKIGAVYLPIDPELPAERIDFIISDCHATRVITQRGSVTPSNDHVQRIDCGAAAEEILRQPVDNLGVRVGSETPAYVMYTSGSTGVPKGVVVPHRAVNRLAINNGYAQIGPDDCILHHSNPAFDASTFEVWGALLNGARIVIVPQEVVLDAYRFAHVLSRERVSAVYMSVGLFNQYVEVIADALARLRYVLVGGDTLDPNVICRLLALTPRANLLNVYGPTESTTFATSYRIETLAEDAASIPIGRPISNTRVYILDARQEVAPIGVTGELCIAGDGIASGYLNRPELTDERFVSDPFSPARDARMYRTGDLARWRADGTIEYLGRNDLQVKIRGFRIELGEVESRLARLATVREVVVLARQDEPGEKQLVAYIVPKHPAQPPSPDELRSHLKTTLPDYMVPSVFVILDRMPLSSSGKVDRRALPAPSRGAGQTGTYEEPQGEIEEILAGIWQELLRVDRIGRRDNFFELGGHSLLIVQMMQRLRRFGLSTEVRRVFDSSTLADLAASLTDARVEPFAASRSWIPKGCEYITPEMLPLVQLTAGQIETIVRTVPGGARNIDDIYPLAPLQEGILFHHLLDRDAGDTYVLPIALEVSSRERLDELIAALQATIDRHDVLRTAVLWEGLPRPMQVVYRNAMLPVHEAHFDPQRDPIEEIRNWLRPEHQRLNLRRGPLMRLQIAADRHSARWYAVLQLHHIVIDHVSVDVVISEVVARLEHRQPQLVESMPYRKHVAHALAYQGSHDAEGFFRRKLGGIDEPTAPFGLTDVRSDGTSVVEADEEVEPAVARQVRAHARRLAISCATIFHAAWALVVARTSGRDDVVFGTVLLGRLQGGAEAEHTLGLFINTLPLRVRLAAVTAQELVEQTQRELVDLLSHEQASLAVAQRCSDLHGSSPLFAALLNYRHSVTDPHAQWSGAQGIRVVAGSDRTNYPITVSVDDLGEGFKVTAQTDRRVDPRRLTAYLRTAVASLVDALSTRPQTSALELSVLPPSELRELLGVHDDLSHSCQQEPLIHELFEEQARRTPDRVAVSCEEHSLTYAELNERANRLAAHLVHCGAGPNQLVALCVERNMDLAVGVLGILKSGAGYLPLDPHYPADRIRYMLEDAAPRVLLTQDSLRGLVAGTPTHTIAIDTDWEAIASDPDDEAQIQRRAGSPDQLAYVIYTSGSTGKPKGVMVEHRNVTRLFSSTARWFRFDEHDVWTLFHSIAFDFSVWELWGALFYGGRVVIVPYSVARSPEDFYRLVCEQRVTVLNQTPSAFVQLIDAQRRQPLWQHALRLVIFGGEALELRTLQPWVERNDDVQPQLVNMYGITETTVHVTYRPLTAQDIWSERASIIGGSIPDLRVYVLNRHRQPVPFGVIGEMYVGGAGVARGYLHRTELTAERFIVDPFCGGETRMYKTGDLARLRADRTLEYLGRNDDQVKIRGFRIELGEIEAQLASHQEVKEVAAVTRDDALGEKRIVAYVVPHDGCSPSVEALRTHLKGILPEYMLPAAFVVVPDLPLTSNGKLDRRALPSPELDAYTSRQYEPPKSATEEAVAAIWQEVLQVCRVGRLDDFFELGGHSLLAMQVMVRISLRFDIELPVRALFDFHTLQGLCAHLERVRRSRTSESIERGGTEVEGLLEKVASMSDREVQEMLQELRTDSRL